MTIYNGEMGALRRAQERERVAGIIARAMPAEGCGPAIPIAPARGPSVAVTPNVVMPDEKSETGYKVEATGWRGFRAARAIDVFDTLDQREAVRARKEGRHPVPPFSKAQVTIARHYRDLVERHDAGGMRCASLEARGSGGGSSGSEFIDAYLATGIEIQQLRQRVGAGAAMVVRRVRPSARGKATASIIRDRDLIDAVCLHGKSFREVLDGHGWTGTSRNIALLVDALKLSLDRMLGKKSGSRKNSSLIS